MLIKTSGTKDNKNEAGFIFLALVRRDFQGSGVIIPHSVKMYALKN